MGAQLQEYVQKSVEPPPIVSVPYDAQWSGSGVETGIYGSDPEKSGPTSVSDQFWVRCSRTRGAPHLCLLSGGHLIRMTGCGEARLAAKAARMTFERQGGAAKGTFCQQPSNNPVAAPAAWAVIMFVDTIHDVIAAQKRIERGLVRSILGNIGMHALVPPFVPSTDNDAQ